MPASIYRVKLNQPTTEILGQDLGDTSVLLNEIITLIRNEYDECKPEWKFYNKKSGWIMKMMTKGRNVSFVIPGYGDFRLGFTFGERAEDMVMQSNLPDQIKEELKAARQYAEGRTIQIKEASAECLPDI